MNHYAGLDVSLEETAICIVDETGAIVRELRAPSDPESLISAFNGVALPMVRIGLEACSQSAWLHQGWLDPACRCCALKHDRQKRTWEQCRTRLTAMTRED